MTTCESPTTLGERVATRLKELGMSQAELARRIGLTRSAVSAWQTRDVRTVKAETLLDAARVLKVHPMWLASGRGAKEIDEEFVGQPIATIDDDASDLDKDYIVIPEYQLSFSAGAGSIAESENPDGIPAAYKVSWLQSIGLNPRNARRFRVRGDSMEPTLLHDDRILVDVSQNLPEQIQDGAVYAVRYGESLKVKRLRRRIDGRIVLVSDNPAYSEEVITPEYADDFAIIGRVLERSGTRGL